MKSHTTKSTLLAAILILSAVLLTVYPILTGRFYGTGDMHDVFIPLENFFRQQQLSGHLPLWEPDIAWGFPVLASAQIGFYYPPLLILRFLPLAVYLPLVLVLHLFALAFGSYWFMRKHDSSHTAAVLTGLCIALSGFVIQHIVHLNIILNIAWFPWQLIIMDWIGSAKKQSAHHIITAAAVLAMPFLAGHLHISLLIAMVSIIYLLSLRFHYFSRRSLFSLLLITLLTFMLSAVQLLPTAELAIYSSRGAGGDFSLDRANQHSFPLYHLPTVLFPRFFGVDKTYWGKRLEVEYGIFIGTIPFLLAIYCGSIKFKRYVFFVFMATFGFLLSLGNLSPFRLIGLEPSLWIFSAPARWLFFYTFGTSVLAGHGLDLIVKNPNHFRKISTYTASIISVMVIIWNLIIWNLPYDINNRLFTYLHYLGFSGERPVDYYYTKFDSLINSLRYYSLSFKSPYVWLTLFSLIGLPVILLINNKSAKIIIASISIIELILVSAFANPTLKWSQLLSPPATVSLLPNDIKQKQERILSVTKPGDSGLYLTNPETRPDLNDRMKLHQLLVPATNAQFNIPGIRWPASLDLRTHSSSLEQLQNDDGTYLTDVSIAYDLNIGAILIDSSAPQQITDYINQTSYNNTTIYEFPPSPRVSFISAKKENPLVYPIDSPTQLTWQVNNESPGLFIVRDTWYPGWQASIDNLRVTISPWHNIFRSVSVPAGSHTITMTYRPFSVYFGLFLSLISWSAVILTSLFIFLVTDLVYPQG
ncbi:MAG: YfhO family protein [Candidatus Andersenbacteria bacterium]|nr:YfhO family protein [bacterium]MDZ4225700.1 YfhO family protein [Candidatus Andersenbacteria bacterium]